MTFTKVVFRLGQAEVTAEADLIGARASHSIQKLVLKRGYAEVDLLALMESLLGDDEHGWEEPWLALIREVAEDAAYDEVCDAWCGTQFGDDVHFMEELYGV